MSEVTFRTELARSAFGRIQWTLFRRGEGDGDLIVTARDSAESVEEAQAAARGAAVRWLQGEKMDRLVAEAGETFTMETL